MKIQPGTNLYIATPCYGAMLNAAYVHSLLRTSNRLALANIPHTPAFVPGDSLITRARNVLVAQFMAGPWSHLFFIDGDLRWEPEAVLRLLAAAQHPDIEVACGVYPKKCVPPEFPLNFIMGADRQLNQHADTGYIEIKDAPTGFLMIRRSAFERMMAAYPERRCVLRADVPAEEATYEYALFDCLIDNGRYLSEDFGFSRLWQRIGGKVWMDPEITLSHYGQYEYRASVSSLLVSPGDRRPACAEEVEGWMSPQELAFLKGAAENVESVIEVGSWKGRSTFALLTGCDGPVYAVDHWLGSEDERAGAHAEAATGAVWAQFMANVGQFPNLRVIRKPSLQAVFEAPEADLVFIDAGHRYDEVRADLRAWRPKASKLICGHDFDQPDVARAVREELGEPDGVVGSIWFKEVAA
jgi:hypothetical protein